MKFPVYVFVRIFIVISTLSCTLLGIFSVAITTTTTGQQQQLLAADSKELFIVYRPVNTTSAQQNKLNYQHYNNNSTSIIVWVNETSLATISNSISDMVTATGETKNTVSLSFLSETTSRFIAASTIQDQLTSNAFFVNQHSCEMVRNYSV